MRLAALALTAATTNALVPPQRMPRATRLANTADVEACLNDEFPAFAALVFQNKGLWRGLKDDAGYTVLAPNESVFAALDEKQRAQLTDPRNGEINEKIGAFHVINDPVSKEDLYESSSVITAGGRIDVAPTVVGGLFGFGGKEDGGVTINGAKIISSRQFGQCVVHECDGFCHPKLLERYLDQLRLPGSS